MSRKTANGWSSLREWTSAWKHWQLEFAKYSKNRIRWALLMLSDAYCDQMVIRVCYYVDIIIIRWLFSVFLGPKIIILNGFHCILKKIIFVWVKFSLAFKRKILGYWIQILIRFHCSLKECINGKDNLIILKVANWVKTKNRCKVKRDVKKRDQTNLTEKTVGFIP